MKYLITISLLIISLVSQAQLPDIISVLHKDKIEGASSAKKKLKKYRKYYSKDSASHFQAIADAYGVKLDSTNRKSVLPADLSIAGHSINVKDSAFIQKNLGKYFPEQQAYYTKYQRKKSEFKLDSTDLVEIENTKEDSKRKALLKQKQKEYLISVGYDMDSLGLTLDSLKVVFIQDSLKGVARQQVNSYRDNMDQSAENGVENLASDYVDIGIVSKDAAQTQKSLKVHEEYKSKYGKYAHMNGDSLREGARDYLKSNPYLIQEAQKQDRELKTKYSTVSNSNDLMSAQKSNSLKGKSFVDRLWLGGNFQLDSTEPYAIFFDPAVGYYINRDLLIGVGLKFSYELGDYDRTSQRYDDKRSDFGYKGFVDYTLFRGFYLSGEIENSRILYIDTSDKVTKDWVLSALAGVGKMFNITHGFKMRASVYYNFLHDPVQSPYDSPWIFRIGFAAPKIGKVLN